jgi:hypothetical protein
MLGVSGLRQRRAGDVIVVLLMNGGERHLVWCQPDAPTVATTKVSDSRPARVIRRAV